MGLEFKVQGSGLKQFGLDRIRNLMLTVEARAPQAKGKGSYGGAKKGGFGLGGRLWRMFSQPIHLRPEASADMVPCLVVKGFLKYGPLGCIEYMTDT